MNVCKTGGWALLTDSSNQKTYTKQKKTEPLLLKRHLEFFNTHPYIAAPILGVTLALEEERANGAAVDDASDPRG